MRLLFLILLCYKQTNGQADDEYFKQMARAFPIQKIIPFHRNVQILNAKKFIRGITDDYTQVTKKYGAPETYTVFPAISTKSQRVTYFPIETLFGQNTILRRVPYQRLLNYSRFKRSALANVTKPKTRRHRNDDRNEKYVPNIARNDKIKNKNRISKARSISVTSKRSKTRENRKEERNLKTAPKSDKGKKDKGTKTRDDRVTRKNKRSQSNKSRSKRNRKESRRSENNNQRVNASRRLLAGKDSTIEQYPYLVSIQKQNEHWCSGALLNPRIVITTANCVWKSLQVTRMKIRAGSKYSDRGGQTASIQEMMRHPGWSIRHNPDYDVALLLLDRNLRFSHSIHAVDLPNRSMMPAFQDAWVTSWGSDKRDGVYHNTGFTLQAYNAKIMDYDKCRNITLRFGVFVTRNFFCMSQMGRRSPCTRDTGAPAVSDGVLWGLASWGLRKLCGTERFPAMFTYVGSTPIMNFLENTTRQLMADERFYPYPDRIAETWIKELMVNKSMTKAG